MSNAFLDTIKTRRTIYALGDKLSLSEDQISTLITEAVKQSPSAFNSQSSRVVILFGAQHKNVWDIVKQTLKKIVPEAAFPTTEKKIDSFGAGAGTVLFFEDTQVIEEY